MQAFLQTIFRTGFAITWQQASNLWRFRGWPFFIAASVPTVFGYKFLDTLGWVS